MLNSCQSKEKNYEEISYIYSNTTTQEQRKIASEKHKPKKLENIKNIHEFIKESFDRKKITHGKKDLKIQDFFNSIMMNLGNENKEDTIKKIKYFISEINKNNLQNSDENYHSSPLKEAHFILAIAYLLSGDEENGLFLLEKIALFSQKWCPVYCALSNYYLNNNATSLALQVATKGLDTCHGSQEKLFTLQAQAYLNKGKKQQAKETLRRAESLYPKNQDIQFWIGIINLLEGKEDHACKIFENSFYNTKTDPFLSYHHSLCLLKKGDITVANEIIQQALLAHPSFSYLYHLKGILENKRKNYLAAQQYWKVFLSLTSKEDPNYNIVAFKLKQMKSEEKMYKNLFSNE
jgi:Tfp pilus assembly protein PilF